MVHLMLETSRPSFCYKNFFMMNFLNIYIVCFIFLALLVNNRLCPLAKIPQRDDFGYLVESYERESSKINASIGDICPQG